jgi:hypothetical protein
MIENDSITTEDLGDGRVRVIRCLGPGQAKVCLAVVDKAQLAAALAAPPEEPAPLPPGGRGNVGGLNPETLNWIRRNHDGAGDAGR